MDLGIFSRPMVVLVATWYAAAVLALALGLQPQASCTLELDEWGETVLRRGLVAAVRTWAIVLLLHVVASGIVFEVRFTWVHLAPFLLILALLHREEGWVWVSAVTAVLFAYASEPGVAPTALAAGLVLGWRGWRQGRPRYFIGTVLAVHVALRTLGWQQGPVPGAEPWLLAVTGVALVALAWRYRMPLALLPLVPVLPLMVRRLPTLGWLGWGAVLLGFGFLSLVAGVAYNWTHRVVLEVDDGEARLKDGA
jgi:hypothetical protein